MENQIIAGVLMGVGGTVAMDIWALALNRIFGLPMPNWANVGRWSAGVLKGRVFNDDINAVPSVPGELALGWVVHYGVGIVYGVMLALIMGAGWLAAPTFVPAWVFGLLTISAGWFLLHPGMGLGWALSKTPNPWKGRGLGLLAHTMFALGMWLVAVLLAR
ncbi:MAG: DUF2938 domain-containing protein [Paracoccaceae bacterium]|nr:DUF2938 domain-containing protein [Paracoccaceae bacterium]